MNNRYEPKLKALNFQEEAFSFFKDLEYGAIFYEQGLGKTKIAIDLTLYWLKNKILDQVFIVAKKNLITNWYDELLKHTFIVPVTLSNNTADNTNAFLSAANVILFNYEIINNEDERIKTLSKIRKIGIILDESAKIKNPNSLLSKKFHQLSDSFQNKIIMTGTPSANKPEDYWSQIYFLDKGEALGKTYKAFFNQVKVSNKLVNNTYEQQKLEKSVENIKNKIKNFSLRETKKNAGLDLPEKIFSNINIECENNQKQIYETAVENLKAEIIKENIEVEENLDEILKRIIRLMQITSNPKILDNTYKEVTPRVLKTIELVDKIVEKNEKCIIWTSYKFNIDFLKKIFKKNFPVILHGSLDVQTRYKNIQSFKNDDRVKILIATPQSSKEGLTLINANHCIYFDRTLSLDDYLQSQDRIHRIGQTKKCYYYNLIIKDTIDEWVNKLLEAKSNIAQLSSGDISLVEYRKKIDYDFGKIIKRILKL